MTEPTFTGATEDTYAGLATYLRAADRGEWPLKRFLAPLLDQLGAVQNLYDRFDYRSPDEFGADTRPLTFYTNLAVNGSYEEPAPLPDPFAVLNCTAGRVPAVAGSTDGGDWAWQFTAAAAGAFGGFLQFAPMPVSTNLVTVSADLVTAPGKLVTWAVYCYDAASTYLGSVLTEPVPYTGNGYEVQRMVVTARLMPGTTQVRIGPGVVAVAAGEKFIVDCLLVVEGDTDYPYRRYAGVATGQASELATPETAEDTWLPWLAQLVGVDLNPALSREAKVDAIRFASAGWRGGTKAAVAAAAKSVLTGTKYVKVYDHSTEAGVGTGGQWDVLLVTRATETPDVGAVLDAVVAQNAKPAGVVLHHLAYNASWADIEAAYPTWAAWRAAGSWATIEEAGL